MNQCHISSSSSSSSSSSTDNTMIVPNRVVIELTADLIYPSPIPTTTSNIFSSMLSNFLSDPTSPLSSYKQQEQNIVKDISIIQFIYSLYSITTTTPTVIAFFIQPNALFPEVSNILYSLSQFVCSFVSFQSQTVTSGFIASSTQIKSAEMLFGDKFAGLFTIFKFPRLNTVNHSYKLPDSILFLYKLKKQLTATLTSTSTTTMATIGITKLVLPPEISRSGNAHGNVSTSGNGNTDLFAEAIEELTAAVTDQELNNNNHHDNKGMNQKQLKVVIGGNKPCPTCGNTGSTFPANPLAGSSLSSSPFSSIQNLKGKQQQQVQQQTDMVILEEEDEEAMPENELE
jgi:hypothetical protein